MLLLFVTQKIDCTNALKMHHQISSKIMTKFVLVGPTLMKAENVPSLAGSAYSSFAQIVFL